MNQIILLVLGAIKSERRISSSSMWVSGTSTCEFRRMPWTTAQHYPGLDLCLRLRRLNLKHFKAAFQSIWLQSFNEGKAVKYTIFWYILTLWGNVEYLGHWFSRSWVKSSKRLQKTHDAIEFGKAFLSSMVLQILAGHIWSWHLEPAVAFSRPDADISTACCRGFAAKNANNLPSEFEMVGWTGLTYFSKKG